MIKMSIRGASRVLWIMLISVIFTQGMWISAWGTNEDIKIKSIEKETECLKISVNIPQIVGKYGDKVNKEILDDVDKQIKDINTMINKYKVMGYDCNMQYQFYATNEIKRESKNIISFYIDYYQYLGGAHGMTVRKAYNVSKKTGDLIKLSELFKKGYDYKSKIDNIIKSKIDEDKDKYFDDGADFTGVNDMTKYYLEDENLVIYYGLYEIAPYAAGIIEFEIPLNSLKRGILYDKI